MLCLVCGVVAGWLAGRLGGARQLCRVQGAFEEDVHVLAASTLALLEDDVSGAASLFGESSRERAAVMRRVFAEMVVGDSEKMTREAALELFAALARELVRELAARETHGAASAAARRALFESRSAACDEIAASLLAIADVDGDGMVSIAELGSVFEAARAEGLDAIAAKLQLLPPHLRGPSEFRSEAQWHAQVPGDAHVLKQWFAPDFEQSKLSIVGIGRSADASAYYLPELKVVLDAGLSVKSLDPKFVLLTHGHRDHTQALPSLARRAQFGRGASTARRVLLPREIEPLARRFVQSEAALNFGRAQAETETDAALGALEFVPVSPGDEVALSDALTARVFEASHKPGVPAVAYGLYRRKKRLRPEFAGASADFIKANRDRVIERYDEGLLFYSGDTTIETLRRHPQVLADFPYVIHECTFLGPPDDATLEAQCAATGHTHFAQLFPLICAHPDTTFVLVHFSTRYSQDDILRFFDANYGGRPHNLVLWI